MFNVEYPCQRVRCLINRNFSTHGSKNVKIMPIIINAILTRAILINQIATKNFRECLLTDEDMDPDQSGEDAAFLL